MVPTVKDIAHLPVDRLPPLVHVPPVTKPFDVTIRPPGSKSLTNRALLLAALAEGESVLTGALADADDAQVMVRALRQLGAEIDVTPEVEPNGESCGNATIRVRGVGGRWKIKPGEVVTLNLNNAGTATRFLTAAAVLQPPESGGIIIDGNARMRERPIAELVEALKQLGVAVEYRGREGYPPLVVRAHRSMDNLAAELTIGVAQSSQFVSGLLLAAAFLPRGLLLHLKEPVTSEAYVELTDGVLREAGVRPSSSWPQRAGYRSLKVWPIAERIAPPLVPGSPASFAPFPLMPLPAFRIAILPDKSALAFPLVATLIVSGALLDIGMQGPLDHHAEHFEIDRAVVDPRLWYSRYLSIKRVLDTPTLACTLRQMGLRSKGGWTRTLFLKGPMQVAPISVSLSKIPDETMALAVAAAFATGGSSELRGLHTLRVKETDRITALVTELSKVGVTVEPFAYTDDGAHPDEGIHIFPPPHGIDCSPHAPAVEFDTYDDHRMAMSLALIGLRRPNVYIRDPGCVRKTYPTFWRDLAKVYG
ncbi:MAG TPA: hypothetical protein VFF65_12525 [Phycisphaerales bacterium]|nr:hypothetical protein [Phycisphaerales bacterium]